MNDIGHTKDSCALCRAVESMKRDAERQAYLARMLAFALDEWPIRATTKRLPAITTDDVLDASEALWNTTRIPSEWMEAKF